VRAGCGVGLAVACLVVSACSTVMHTADRDFAAGSYPAATAGYEKALTATLSPEDHARALYRLGLVAALPGEAGYDPNRARQHLDLLLSRFPGSSYSVPARAILNLQDVAETAAKRAAELEAEVGRLRDEAKASASAVQARDALIARLRASLADSEAELKRVRSELDQLKAIDLRRRP
jgi:hypothetical protein